MERYYKILGISIKATKEEVKKAYHDKIKALHPDKIHGTALEDTATFFTTEINEAYNIIISQFENNSSSEKQNTQKRCIEEETYVNTQLLKYSLSDDFNLIISAICIRTGIKNINTNNDIEWTLNTGLSESVKTLMIKHNVEYSMTIYKEGRNRKIIINKRKGDQWFFVFFNEKSGRFSKSSHSCFEEELLLDGWDFSLTYSLSNDLCDIRNAIYERTGYNIELENEVPKLNRILSSRVKNLMNKLDVDYSMTTYLRGGNIQITINRRVFDKWYIVQFQEIDGKLYRSADLEEIERKKRLAYGKYQSDIDEMNAEIETSRFRTHATLNILGGIWNIIKDAGKVG